MITTLGMFFLAVTLIVWFLFMRSYFSLRLAVLGVFFLLIKLISLGAADLAPPIAAMLFFTLAAFAAWYEAVARVHQGSTKWAILAGVSSLGAFLISPAAIGWLLLVFVSGAVFGLQEWLHPQFKKSVASLAKDYALLLLGFLAGSGLVLAPFYLLLVRSERLIWSWSIKMPSLDRGYLWHQLATLVRWSIWLQEPFLTVSAIAFIALFFLKIWRRKPINRLSVLVLLWLVAAMLQLWLTPNRDLVSFALLLWPAVLAALLLAWEEIHHRWQVWQQVLWAGWMVLLAFDLGQSIYSMRVPA